MFSTVMTASVTLTLALLTTAGPAADTEIGKLREKYETLLEEIDRDHKEATDELHASYGKSLTKLRADLRGKGKLDGVLAVERERERFTESREVPETPPEGLNAHVAALQAKLHAAKRKQDADTYKRVITLASQYTQRLTNLERKLTSDDKLEEAINVRKERERVAESHAVKSARFGLDVLSAAARQEGEPEEAETDATGSDKPAPDDRIARLNTLRMHSKLRMGVRGRVYANCDNSFELHLNDKSLLQGSGNGCWSETTRLCPGDVLKVRAVDAGGARGFALIFMSNDRKSAFCTKAAGWQQYVPESTVEWWKIEDIEKARMWPAKPGDNQRWKGQLDQASGYVCEEAIWGDFRESTVYLIKTIGYEDLMPREE